VTTVGEHAAAFDPGHRDGEARGLWDAVDRLVERAPRPSDLYNHRLEFFGAHWLRKNGRPVPPSLAMHERRSAALALCVPAVLARARAATDVPLLLFKGPEVAARYPDPALRMFRDVDLIAPDAAEAQQALLAAGFQEVGDPDLYRDIHHLRPLKWPGLPLVVELHSEPKWVEPLAPPDLSSLFEDSRPAVAGPEGVLTPSPARHAVLLAVHSWAHEPLRILRDMVDVAALEREASREESFEVAREWGVERLWSTTVAALDCIFAGGRPPAALRIWAKNLALVRERTVLEAHLERWLADFSALPFGLALRRVRRTISRELTPDRGEGWRRKLSRSRLAVRNAARRRSDHEREAGLG
jgi:hypothetical protein